MQAGNFLNLAYFFQKIYDIFSGQYFPGADAFLSLTQIFLAFIRPFSVLLTLLFLTGIIYCLIRTQAVFQELKEKTHGHTTAQGHDQSLLQSAAFVLTGGETAQSSNPRWLKIIQNINSDNPSDWRLAILECDIILDEMLSKMSYHGETLSDKLKAVEKSDFLTIDKAWEAHRVRNVIAHEGGNFIVTEREAKRVVGLYGEVFKEFRYI